MMTKTISLVKQHR